MRFGQWFESNWVWIVIGCILTKMAIKYAYIERGYRAYGGEWLILPVILIFVSFVKDMISEVRRIREEEKNEIRIGRNLERLQERRPTSKR